ncbi:MAG: hypothetical protein ACK4TR_08925 [Phenylobacterium sp.]|uniref:hypothetical protein n=1 Tax=Phenylobacterium sp. TaxID=1871053 RepID=UPI00391B6DFA
MARLFPRTPDEFIAELERRAPEPRFGPDQTERQVMFDAGRRAVVREMRDFFIATFNRNPDVRHTTEA